MTEEQQTTGTPEPDDGDAQGTATTGTPEQDDRNADGESTISISKGEFEAWKNKVEDENRASRQLEIANAKLAVYEERSEHTPAATDAGTRNEESELEERAANGEASAIMELLKRERKDRQRLQQNVGHYLEAIEVVPDQSKRKEVLKEFKTGRYADIEAAADAVEGRALRARVAEQDAKIARLEGSRKPPDTVRTVHRDAPASNGTPTKMTRAEWRDRQESLPDEDRRREQRLYRTGKLKVDG